MEVRILLHASFMTTRMVSHSSRQHHRANEFRLCCVQLRPSEKLWQVLAATFPLTCNPKDVQVCLWKGGKWELWGRSKDPFLVRIGRQTTCKPTSMSWWLALVTPSVKGPFNDGRCISHIFSLSCCHHSGTFFGVSFFVKETIPRKQL